MAIKPYFYDATDRRALRASSAGGSDPLPREREPAWQASSSPWVDPHNSFPLDIIAVRALPRLTLGSCLAGKSLVARR